MVNLLILLLILSCEVMSPKKKKTNEPGKKVDQKNEIYQNTRPETTWVDDCTLLSIWIFCLLANAFTKISLAKKQTTDTQFVKTGFTAGHKTDINVLQHSVIKCTDPLLIQ
ncbi:uncharacterized protein LOC143246757 isoform X1 [Tachypleus tridentatus]|uniref:uncharacterized protein LOC143246757 isoform X1 n=1 Tax=Tachypleus tridentatus TaxID=6853 RepID=UPI003FD29C28